MSRGGRVVFVAGAYCEKGGRRGTPRRIPRTSIAANNPTMSGGVCGGGVECRRPDQRTPAAPPFHLREARILSASSDSSLPLFLPPHSVSTPHHWQTIRTPKLPRSATLRRMARIAPRCFFVGGFYSGLNPKFNPCVSLFQRAKSAGLAKSQLQKSFSKSASPLKSGGKENALTETIECCKLCFALAL